LLPLACEVYIQGLVVFSTLAPIVLSNRCDADFPGRRIGGAMLDRIACSMTLATILVASSWVAPDDDFRNAPFGWVSVSKGSTIATSGDELDRLNERAPDQDRVLFAHFGEDEYLIRERATLDRVDQLLEPVRRLGEKAREIGALRGTNRSDKLHRRAWKARLRPLKEERRQLLLDVSGQIEALARDAVRRGQAQRLK